ncbi:MAG: shikimate dehydrogenase [Rhizobiaceae bacterium]|nr:shikimate dehydrogenase [Rhizobiaceae bacterium]
MTITGKTVCYPLIGHPVGQVRTPPVINDWFVKNGIDATMFAMDVPPADVEGFFALLKHWENCGGCSVTVPYKQITFRSMNVLTPRAKRVGSVNIVRREDDGCLIGDMTDGVAFVAALKLKGHQLTGAKVLLAGAGGGAGAAIADAICEEGIGALSLIEPNADRLERIRSLLHENYPKVLLDNEPSDAGGYDLAINASTLGMNKWDPIPISLQLIRADGIVADVVTQPEITPLLAEAQKCSLKIQTGNEMAFAQLEFQMRHLGLWH